VEVGKQHLRLASYTHAFPKRSSRYLMLDCEKPIKAVSELTSCLRLVFNDNQGVTFVPTKSA
jgi:hypothetical protein